MSSAHIVCLPSYYNEGLPKVLCEAAAAGRAVITTDEPGCRDAIANGETGLLVPSHNPLALANCVEFLLSDITLLKNIICLENEYPSYLISSNLHLIYRFITVFSSFHESSCYRFFRFCR